MLLVTITVTGQWDWDLWPIETRLFHLSHYTWGGTGRDDSQSVNHCIDSSTANLWVCTLMPFLPSSFIVTHTHQQHITLFFQSRLWHLWRTVYARKHAHTYTHAHKCTRTQPTHWANPITNWSSLVLNPCTPDADFTRQHHFQLHHSEWHGSRTTNQGRQQR